MSNKSAQTIHDAVREYYGDLAHTRHAQTESCCGPGACDCGPHLYSPEQVAQLPGNAAALSFGCGDPVSVADIRPGDTVLDLGSGGGIDCFLAARRVGPTGHVIGVDMTPEMLAQARANALKMQVANVEFRQGQIEALPVADGEADVILSNCVINLAPDKAQVFREMLRVLKPGGRVTVADIVTNGPLSPRVAKDMESWAACVAGAWEARAYQAGLETAGFVDVEVRQRSDDLSLASLVDGMPFSAIITARKPESPAR